MASVKELIGGSVRFEKLFDDYGPTIGGREFFKESVFKELMSSGEQLQVDMGGEDGADLVVRKIDEHASQGYNVFRDTDEYETWLQQSLHDPSEEEIMEALKDGSGT